MSVHCTILSSLLYIRCFIIKSGKRREVLAIREQKVKKKWLRGHGRKEKRRRQTVLANTGAS